MIDKKKREYLFENLKLNCAVFDDPSFDRSIIGITPGGHVVYNFDMMVEELSEDEDMDEADAFDFIDYNTMRALPYIDEDIRPIVMYTVEV